MAEHNTVPQPPDLGLAVSLAPLDLGVNIALHGWTRVFLCQEFAADLDQQFAQSILAGPLVHVSAVAIVGTESLVGILLLVGFALRAALAAGMLLMTVLLFRTCLVQNWGAAGDPLICLAFFGGLLALRSRDSGSLGARLNGSGKAPRL
jgi:thiosulfate dehydrogenase [quinone] large subunit